jgi:hypothetical protein
VAGALYGLVILRTYVLYARHSEAWFLAEESAFPNQSSLRSDHVGFIDSMSEIFFDRRQPLISFSRWMASRKNPQVSK